MEALAHGGLDDFARATAIFEEVVAAMPSKQMAALAGAINLRGITGMRETLANLALTAIDTSALASMQNAFVKVDASALSSFTGIENVFAAIDAPALTTLQQAVVDSAFAKIDTSALSGFHAIQDTLAAIDTTAFTTLQQAVADSAFAKIDTSVLVSLQGALPKVDVPAFAGVTGLHDAFIGFDTAALSSLQHTIAETIDTNALMGMRDALTAIATSGIASMQGVLAEQLTTITSQLDLMEPLRRLTTDLVADWASVRGVEPLLAGLFDQADFGASLSGIDWSGEFNDTFGHLNVSAVHEWLDVASRRPGEDLNAALTPVVMLLVAVALAVVVGPTLISVAESLAVEVIESIYFTLLLANEVGSRSPALGGAGYLITAGSIGWGAWKIARAALPAAREDSESDEN